MTGRLTEQDLNLSQFEEAGTDLEESTMRMWAMACELPDLIRKASDWDVAANESYLRELANMILAALETKQ
jgi:hypothetical protein